MCINVDHCVFVVCIGVVCLMLMVVCVVCIMLLLLFVLFLLVVCFVFVACLLIILFLVCFALLFAVGWLSLHVFDSLWTYLFVVWSVKTVADFTPTTENDIR